MTAMLTQNAKMRKTAKATGVAVFNFGIPAFKSVTGLMTCPNAKNCVAGCYARSGTYRFKNSVNAYEKRLELTLSSEFADIMTASVTLERLKAERNGQRLYIRIHDSGDFYSEEYLMKWIDVMKRNPSVQFYAYTKQVSMIKKFRAIGFLPDNFTVIFSLGGREDGLINRDTDRHARVFDSIESLQLDGYVNGTDDDMVAASGLSNLIGLVYHGAKNYVNTAWGKVSNA